MQLTERPLALLTHHCPVACQCFNMTFKMTCSRQGMGWAVGAQLQACMAQAGPVHLLLHNGLQQAEWRESECTGTHHLEVAGKIHRGCSLIPSMTSSRQWSTEFKVTSGGIVHTSSAAQLTLAAASCGASADRVLLQLPRAGASLQRHQSGRAGIHSRAARQGMYAAMSARVELTHLGTAYCGAQGCPGSTAGVLG